MTREYSRRDFMKLAGIGLGSCAFGIPAFAQPKPKTQSVVVLGIDGMDPTLLQKYILEGKMPNAKRLMEQGGFAPLQTSNPPQSPVAWSNFISGTNAGGHGIFDFIARDPSTMTPFLATSRMEAPARNMSLGNWQIPLSGGDIVNLRGGETFWTTLEKHGVDCTVLRMPSNFPPTPSRARTLAGLGTPDIHGSYGIFSFYTNKRGMVSRDVPGGRIARVRVRQHTAACVLKGPMNSFHKSRATVDIPFNVYLDPDNPLARVSVQDKEFILKEGEWSDWKTLQFSMLPHLVDVAGICRFFLMKAGKSFELYITPVNIDPRKPALPISTPTDYSRQLAERIGNYYTQGMPPDTSALSSGVFDDNQYREQATSVLNEELKMFDSEFGRFQKGFFFFYFCSLDLNSHAFWRTIDPGHPLYSEKLAKKQGDFLPSLYQKMDAQIGKAMKRINKNTLLMIVSDHGFGTFRRQFNLNTWLLDNGYAAPASRAGHRGGEFFSDIRWAETKAYGLGINSLYLNVRGREADGIVRPGRQLDKLKEELITGLQSVRDPDTSDKVIATVYDPTKAHSGPFLDRAPDLIVGYSPNYRASWDTILGKYPQGHVLDNKDPWSGDHTIDSKFMSGVLLSNRAITSKHPALWDMAPSILTQFGSPVPGAMTGKNVFRKS